ncbi:translation initiation factor IF-2-like [Crotalus tigris]|uniref:translation initiation factor IF-2-like n=1 Tax=Crotalus tigris TaxID=88082 RepID=UPI00192F38F1|nr:translation initiation factor IF-2-like [Crotalus tigris]
MVGGAACQAPRGLPFGGGGSKRTTPPPPAHLVVGPDVALRASPAADGAGASLQHPAGQLGEGEQPTAPQPALDAAGDAAAAARCPAGQLGGGEQPVTPGGVWPLPGATEGTGAGLQHPAGQLGGGEQPKASRPALDAAGDAATAARCSAGQLGGGEQPATPGGVWPLPGAAKDTGASAEHPAGQQRTPSMAIEGEEVHVTNRLAEKDWPAAEQTDLPLRLKAADMGQQQQTGRRWTAGGGAARETGLEHKGGVIRVINRMVVCGRRAGMWAWTYYKELWGQAIPSADFVSE